MSRTPLTYEAETDVPLSTDFINFIADDEEHSIRKTRISNFLLVGPEINIKNPLYDVIGDSITDDTIAIQAVINAAASTAILKMALGTYRITSQLTIPSNLIMQYDGIPSECILNFDYPGSAQDMMKFNANSNITLEGFTMNANQSITLVNGNCVDMDGASNVTLKRMRFLNAPDDGIDIKNSTNVTLEECEITGSQSSGVLIHTGSSYIYISESQIYSNSGMGIQNDNVSHLYYDKNRLYSNGREAIGIRYNCQYGSIIRNWGYGNGDNGISITGTDFHVSDNTCEFNSNNGIALYGKNNTAINNTCRNNSQAITDTYAGIAFLVEFGGEAKDNICEGNHLIDDQLSPTQKAGIWLSGNRYTSWQAVTSVAASAYRTSGNRIYFTTNGGTTGSTAPVHTSGTVNDGGVDWLYLATNPYGFQAANNSIGLNHSHGNVQGSFKIDSTALNTYFSRSKTAFGVPVATAWTTSSTVNFGDLRYYTDTNSITRTYRSVSVTGTTGATPPTHSSGTVTDGTISWLYLSSSDRTESFRAIENGFEVPGEIDFINVQDPTQTARMLFLAGNPLNLLNAQPGSFALRRASTQIDRAPYFKEFGNDGTGWRRLLTQISGNTANRPGYSGNSYIALPYFDTDLGKPIWWSGSAWVDATGTSV